MPGREIVLYFAYGSNMNVERLIERQVRVRGRQSAILKDHRLAFNEVALRNAKEGYANIVGESGACVEGIAGEVVPSDLDNLDTAEAAPTHYRRDKVTVRLLDGAEVEAVAYVADSKMVRAGLRPTKEYMHHLLAGEKFLSREYFERLKAIETLD
jgi:gamma-glutamylcyclotransferase